MCNHSSVIWSEDHSWTWSWRPVTWIWSAYISWIDIYRRTHRWLDTDRACRIVWSIWSITWSVRSIDRSAV